MRFLCRDSYTSTMDHLGIIWVWVKTLYPFCSHPKNVHIKVQSLLGCELLPNDLMVIGINPWPYMSPSLTVSHQIPSSTATTGPKEGFSPEHARTPGSVLFTISWIRKKKNGESMGNQGVLWHWNHGIMYIYIYLYIYS